MTAVTRAIVTNTTVITVQDMFAIERHHARASASGDGHPYRGPKLAFRLEPVIQIVSIPRPALAVNLKRPTRNVAVLDALGLRARHNR